MEHVSSGSRWRGVSQTGGRKASEGDSQIFGLRNLLEDSVVSFTEVRMIRFGKNSQVLFLTC